jgi:murein tripeptide amidase MpaA
MPETLHHAADAETVYSVATMSVSISSSFDSGNIEVVSIDGDVAHLKIRKDGNADFYQWFHFRIAGAKGRSITLKLDNCGSSAYPDGWKGYRARFSHDRHHWRQETNTHYEEGTLTIEHRCEADVVWFAYFAPYSMERHHDLVARISEAVHIEHVELGLSLDGQPIDCLRMGEGKKQIWLYGRQHPGESMAEWWLEGALEMLAQANDPVVAKLLKECTLHVVPNLNPDGSRRGHLRTNAAGIDLNRQWAEPSAEKSPEVLCIVQAMQQSGVHFAMDVHGDEAIPANFLAGFEGIPNWSDKNGALFVKYRTALTARTHDFQDKLGYPPSPAGKANLAISTNQVANKFACVAMTLEMPFKDHDSHAVPTHGWNPARCKALAHDCLAILADMIADIGA